MAVFTQILGEHRWTKTMDEIATLCGECPLCMTRGVHTHTEFSGGDGERGYVEYECPSCDAEWTDAYNLVTRTVYPAPEKPGQPVENYEFREGVTYRMTNGMIHEVAV